MKNKIIYGLSALILLGVFVLYIYNIINGNYGLCNNILLTLILLESINIK